MVYMDKISFYSQASVAKPLKKFLAYLLDFLVALILMVALFAIEEAIMTNTPLVKEKQDEINKVTNDMYDMVLDAKVGKDRSGTLAGQNDIIEDYLKGVTLSSLKHHGITDISENIYSGYTEMNEDSDYCYYYFVNFKSVNNDSFLAETKKQCGEEYYVSTLKERSNGNIYLDNNESKTIFVTNGYPYLTLDAAKAMNEYLLHENYAVGERISTTIHNSYEKLISSAVSDFQKYYQPYLDKNKEYESLADQLYKVKDVELLISYLVSLALCYIMFPLIFKEGRTLSLKILKLGATNTKNEKVALWNIFAKYGMTILLYGVLFSLTGLFYFSTSALEWIGRSMFLNISFLSIGIFSLFAIMFSFIFSLVLKKHQNFEELVSFELTKDGTQFETKKKEIESHE